MVSIRTGSSAATRVGGGLAVGLIGAALLGTVVTHAQVVTPPPVTTPIVLTPVTINNNPGDQFDPHVSGDWVAYTSDVTIRYYNFATNIDAEIPPGGGVRDLLSDVSGSKIVFSRVFSAVKTAVMVFDTITGTAVEIDPAPATTRFGAAIGGNTVAYIDFGLDPNGKLVVHDLVSQTPVRLTSDAVGEGNPQVSPDGNVVVWERCATTLTNCDIWQAVKTGVVWTVSVVSASTNSESDPDTNGALVVYGSQRGSDSDLFWRPVLGGPEVQLQMPGYQGNPSIASNFIAFESRPTAVDTADIFVYDVVNNRLFQITNTPLVNEQLNDITVLPDGTIHVVWASDEDGPDQRNIKGATFAVPPVFSPSDLLQQLIDLVQSFHLRPGIHFTLEAELWIARALVTSTHSGDPLRACGWVNLFFHEVQALTGRGITAAQAAQLLTLANEVRSGLGCP